MNAVRPVVTGPRLPIEYVEIPGGVPGTIATLEYMADWARRSIHDPRTGGDFVQWARDIVERVPSKDYVGELRALFGFVKRNVRYRLDPVGLERVQAPYWTLCVDGAGDCDDHCALLMGLAGATGHGALARAVKVDPRRPTQYSHVYAVLSARVPGGERRWFGADTTTRQATLGWEPPASRQFGPPLDVIAFPA